MMAQTLEDFALFMKEACSTVYPEPPSTVHGEIIRQMVPKFIARTGLKSGMILDVGCGQGEALIEFGKLGFTAHGITSGMDDYTACRSMGLECWMVDMHDVAAFFAPQYYDALWMRHSAEHSPMPLFLLKQVRKLLKTGGYLYFEVPMPDTACHHELNDNHYSVFTRDAWFAVLMKAGFTPIEWLDFSLETQAGPDKYCVIYAAKS